MEKNPEIQTWAERAEQEQKEIFQYFVPDGTLRSESDTTLSAFAQLAALRLNATRALISLLDSANQYVLVEATRDSRLRRDRPATDENDGLLLGHTTLTRSLGLCGHVLDNVDQHESQLAGEKLWRPPYLLFMVDDVAVDEKLRDHPFVTSHPSVRFYAAMPICTASGLRVGTISVMDERPRKELLGADEIEFLGDIGPAIMAHLETTRISDGHRRGEKMIRGLGVFMEGRTDLRDWWCKLGDSRHASGQQPAVRVHEDDGSTTKVEAAPANSEFADGLAVADRLLVTTPLEYTTDQEPSPSFPETTASRQPTPLAIPPRPSARAGSGHEHGRGRGLEAPGRASLSEGHAQSPPPSRGQSSRTFGPGPMDDPRPISKKLKEMFSRAGHIIQEAIDVDGALFLDARVSTPSERSESVMSTERGGSSRSSTNTSESSPGQAQEHVQAPCRVLSLWTSERSSLHGDGASRLMPLAESFLLGLLNKYPQGHVFSPGEAPGLGHHKKEKGEAAALETMLPGARSVVVVPLWDANAGRWFAAGCMWTVNPTSRVLTRGGDLNYLAAFGNSIMAEVARLDVVRTDRAKSDFISSISHELRSPLHGILASAELLHGTTVDLFQRGMIDTIERCGRTLLDTIQHVLDFAKINNFTKRGSLWGMSNLSVDVNLSLLTEDVVDSVFAGHEFQSESNGPSSPFATGDEKGGGFPAESLRGNSVIDDRGRRSSNEPKKEPIDVILDIAWRPNWFFRTESGALRRVLMNLFGNALKYTDRGWVKVSLQAKDIDATKSTITITVTDSGRGIDPEYLHGALFTPFTQENPLNPGTGLGLSIVLQIVRSLRGRISITSEPGVGTQVVVTLVMKQVPPPHGGGEPRHFLAKNQEAILSARDKTEGLRIGLLGFGSPDVIMRRPENVDGHAEWNSRTGREPSLPLLRQSIESTATQWFGMKIAPPSAWTFSPPDIHIVNERAGIRDAFPGVSVIALCSHEELYREYSRRAARGARRAARELAHFVSKPCGPHKLAEAFVFCLQNISRSSAATSPSTGAPLGAFSSPQNSLFAQTPDNYATDHSRTREDYFSCPTTKAETLTQQAAAAATAEASSSVPGERKPRLLLVEDNKINLHLLSTFIGRCSFDYSTAENGLEAVQAFSAAAEHPYDIILMDISMPIMDGTEATRKIRKLEQAYPRKRPAMVIALTGLGSANSQKDAFDSGVNMFLTKPVRLKDLKKILEDWDPDGVV